MRLATLFALSLAALAACRPSVDPPASPPTPASTPRAVLPSGAVLALEVAITDEARTQGLMYRASLPRNAGMVFLFDRVDVYPFWMKNCHFPLDIVYTLRDGTVTALLENVPPCDHDPCPNYPPAAAADTVLEVNAGVARASGVSVGARVRFEGLPPR